MTETFIQRLEAPFINLFAKIKEEVASLIPAAENIAVEVEQGAFAALEAVFEAGYPIARDAIIAEAPKLISGQEKFGSAVTHVMEALQVKLGPVIVADVQA